MKGRFLETYNPNNTVELTHRLISNKEMELYTGTNSRIRKLRLRFYGHIKRLKLF